MGRYRKKPVVIEAVRWTGENLDAVNGLCQIYGSITKSVDSRAIIPTLEGTMLADVGDMIIRGVKGEVYPCKPDIFDATYDPT